MIFKLYLAPLVGDSKEHVCRVAFDVLALRVSNMYCQLGEIELVREVLLREGVVGLGHDVAGHSGEVLLVRRDHQVEWSPTDCTLLSRSKLPELISSTVTL